MKSEQSSRQVFIEVNISLKVPLFSFIVIGIRKSSLNVIEKNEISVAKVEQSGKTD